MKAFRVDLKACLGLVLPNQYCLIVVRENWGWFFGWCYFVGHAYSFVVPTIQYHHTVWSSEKASITLRCWLCSTCYTAVWIKNCLKNISAIKIATMKNRRFPLQREAIMCYHQINTIRCQQRWMGHKGGHWYVHEECIVHTAVGQKAPVGPKWYRTVKKSSP